MSEIRKKLEGYLSNIELWEIQDQIEKMIGTEDFLLNLMLYISTDDLKEFLKHVARNFDL